MKIENKLYGGFIVSNNVLKGIRILYSFREESKIPQLNGWNVLSKDDDQEYIQEVTNFTILNAESMYKIAPVLLELFDAPYGTDLFWKYEEDVHIGFYDLINECDTDVEQILKNNII